MTPRKKRPARRASRRRFLSGTAAAAAAPLVGAPFVVGCTSTSERSLAPLPPEVLRVGLIGCGGRGTGAAVQALGAEEGTVVLTAMGDAFEDRLESSLGYLSESFPENRVQVDPEHRFVGLDAFQKVIDSDVDVVLLATPPAFRPQHLAYAVEKGKHVFCEKPVAVDAPGVRSVLASAEVARQKGLSLVSGFCWRYHDAVREAFRRIEDGQLGDVRAFYSTYLAVPNTTVARRPEWSDTEYQLRNWYHTLWLCGDHVVEQACHSLDKQGWVFGDEPPRSVVAVGGRQTRSGPDSGNVWDHFSATFEYGDGRKAFHMCRQWHNTPGDNTDHVLGSEGTAFLNGWGPEMRFTGQRPWTWEGTVERGMYQKEHDELFASIRAGAAHNDGVWMARSTLLGIMVRMAAYTGEVVTWDRALASQERLVPEQIAWGPRAMREVAVPGVTPFV